MIFFKKNLFLLCFFISSFAHAGSDQNISLYLPTKGIDGSIGTYISVDAGKVDLGNLASVLEDFKSKDGSTTLLDPSEKVEVLVVVPKGASEEYRNRFKASIEQNLINHYPNLRFQIEESFIDLEESLQKLEVEEQFLENHGNKKTTRAAILGTIQDIIQNIREKKSELQTVLSKWKTDEAALQQAHNRNIFQRTFSFAKVRVNSGLDWLNERNPLNRNRAAKYVGNGKAIFGAGVYLKKYGLFLADGAFNGWALVIAALNAVVVRTLGYYAVEWSQWCTDHKLVGSESIKCIRENKLVQWYNGSPEFKSIFINTLRTAGLATLFRSLAFYTHQSIYDPVRNERVAVGTPWSAEFWGSLALLSSFELLSDSAADVGLRTLRQKGRITYMSQSYLLWTVSILDTIMHSFFRAGVPSVAFSMGAVTWSVRFGLYGIAKKMTAQKPKFVFVSPEVSADDLKLVKGKYNLLESENINFTDEDLQKARVATDEKELLEMLKFTQKDPDRFQEIWERKLAEGESFDLRQACIDSLKRKI